MLAQDGGGTASGADGFNGLDRVSWGSAAADGGVEAAVCAVAPTPGIGADPLDLSAETSLQNRRVRGQPRPIRSSSDVSRLPTHGEVRP